MTAYLTLYTVLLKCVAIIKSFIIETVVVNMNAMTNVKKYYVENQILLNFTF